MDFDGEHIFMPVYIHGRSGSCGLARGRCHELASSFRWSGLESQGQRMCLPLEDLEE